eukprot:420722_1
MEQLAHYLCAPNTIKQCKSDIGMIATTIIDYLSHFELIDFENSLNNTANIRNVTIIDDNKTDKIKPSLTKSMLMDDIIAAFKLKPFENSSSNNRFTTFCIEAIRNNNKYFMSFIDSCHNYFNCASYDINHSLRLTDGVLFVIDCTKPIGLNIKFCMQKCIQEQNEPILFINGIEKLLHESCSKSNEECYQILLHQIQKMNTLWNNTTNDNDEKKCESDKFPASKVIFGSSKYEFAFTLETFATVNNIDVNKLWGNNYWNSNDAKWYSDKNKDNIHGFQKFIWIPLKTVFDITLQKKDIMTNIIEPMNLMLHEEQIPTDDMDATLNIIFTAWLPIRKCILDAIIQYIPSPIQSQQHKIKNIYSGPYDSEEYIAMMNCDKTAHVSMQITRIISDPITSKCLVLGRVFSGTIHAKNEVRILGTDYVVGKKRDLFIKKISNIKIITSSGFMQSVSECPAGNICCIASIAQFVLKQATVTTSPNMYPMTVIKSIAGVCNVAVEPAQAIDLPKLISGLRQLTKQMPNIRAFASLSGEHIIEGVTEKHILCAVAELKTFAKNIKIRTSVPCVPLRETIISNTIYPKICVAKSPNKHNRLYVNAEPMDNELINEIEQNGKAIIVDVDEKQVWSFGCAPDAIGNCIVNQTKEVMFIDEIRDSIIGAFYMSTSTGVLCEQPIRGMRVNLVDAILHPDAIRRGAGQIMPTLKRAVRAAQIACSPRLMVPMYVVDINVMKNKKSVVLKLLNEFKSVNVKGDEEKEVLFDYNEDFVFIELEISVFDMLRFEEMLRSDNVRDDVEYRMKFERWKIVESDPFEIGSESNVLLMETRKRIGLRERLPVLSDYYDKI